MNSLARLSQIIESLKINARKKDTLNASSKVHQLIENNNIFSSELFFTQSDCYLPYVKEIQQRLTNFSRLVDAGKTELSTQLLHQIEQQIAALSNALNSNSTLHQAAKLSVDAHNKVKIKKLKSASKYKNVAKKVLLSSQQLYQKLAEHHGYEQRLMDMVREREVARIKSKKVDNDKISYEVLALHQRLGRCRKAISTIEREIEFLEKR